jgi:hypothetical protein
MTIPTDRQAKYRLIGWAIGIIVTATLLVTGYLTSDQWVAVVTAWVPW